MAWGRVYLNGRCESHSVSPVKRVSVREEYRHPTSPQSKVLSVHATVASLLIRLKVVRSFF